MTLEEEARWATESLKGKVVEVIWRHRAKEVVIKFADGTTFFVDHEPDGLGLSITKDGFPQFDDDDHINSD